MFGGGGVVLVWVFFVFTSNKGSNKTGYAFEMPNKKSLKARLLDLTAQPAGGSVIYSFYSHKDF